MPTLSFRIVNVFTRGTDPFSGNPLCVFENAESLDGETMQRLARQFNLSETTFLTKSPRASAHVRIFTPAYEMPFAGHPTLGSAYVCRALGWCTDEATLEMKAGLIPVRAQDRRWTLQANPSTSRACDVTVDVLADMLGLGVEDIDSPALWVKAGKEQLIVPLKNEAAVRKARPRAEKFAAVKSDEGHSCVYVFAQLAPGQLLGRFFFPQDSAIIEDPATGSATANLGGWFIASGKTLPVSYEIAQGEYVSRPSRLFLHVDEERRIFVSGDVLEIGRGTIEL